MRKLNDWSGPQGPASSNLGFIFLIAGVFLVPLAAWVSIPGANVWYSQLVVYWCLTAAYLSLNIWSFNKPLSVLCLNSSFSAFFVANQQPRALIVLTCLFFGVYLAFFISKLARPQLELLLTCLLWLAGANAIYTLVQVFNLDPFFYYVDTLGRAHHELDSAVGFLGNGNQAALFWAVLSPVILSYAWWLLPAAIFGLWQATTTVCWLAFMVATLWWCWLFQRKIFMLFFAFIISASLVFFMRFELISARKIIERVELVQHCVKEVTTGRATMRRVNGQVEQRQEITANPLFGFGLGNFMRISPLTQWQFLDKSIKKGDGNPIHRYEHAHNDYVEYFYETGWVGLVVLCWVLVDFAWRFIKANKTKLLVTSFLAVVAQLVCAMGIYTVQTILSATLLVIFLGIFYSEEKHGQPTAVV